MRLGEKLQKLVVARETTQGDLAKAIGTYPSRVSEWVNETGKPSIKQALLAARFLSVPLEYLADDDQDDPPSFVETDRRRRIWELVELVGEDEALRRLAKVDSLGERRVFVNKPQINES